MAVMPMFPLGMVLLPGNLLPLHVFEPRYRQMVRECLDRDEPEFGVVLIEQGSEVGGGERRRMVGTVARMVQVAEMPDGRYAVMSVGTARVKVNAWLPDDPYPLADVEAWPDDADESPGASDAVEALAARVRRTMALALELGDTVGDPQQAIDDNPWVAVHQLAEMAPLGVTDRFDVLCAANTDARIALMMERLDDVEALLHMRLADG